LQDYNAWLIFKEIASRVFILENGFKYNGEGGADIIFVRMIDFQIIRNVKCAMNVLNSDLDYANNKTNQNIIVEKI
jgi:hypothetical protein